KSASAAPGAIVSAHFGAVNLYDLKPRKTQRVDIAVSGDMPEVRPRLDKVERFISTSELSPTGARALFQARGEIFTVPAEKGDVRNLTNTTGIAERDPSWSPDGKRIAYFSDESGEYSLHLRPQDGLGETEKISLGSPPTYYYMPVWSPDSKRIAYTDKRLNVWYIDLEKKTPTLVDTDYYDGPKRVRESMSMPMFASLPMTECGWKTSTQTTTKWGQTGWRSTMITLAVHPWHGESVAVLQSFGDRAVVVEREDGDRRIIPVFWTSLAPLVSCRLSDGRTIRISPQTAIELSRWVSTRRDGKTGSRP
ncbi:MAG: hypothetical protein ACRDFW_03765, partial [bacterium]